MYTHTHTSIGFKMCIIFVAPLFYVTKLQKCHPHTSNSGLPFFHTARKTPVQRPVYIDWLLLELVAIPQQHHQRGQSMGSQATNNVIVRTW
jgi:hypothetical protein